MKKILITTSLALVMLLSACQQPAQKTNTQSLDEQTSPLTTKTMNLSSTVFEHNGQIPSKYTCDGEDINPPLHIDGVPETARSLVLIVDDPDAPAGDWVHWTVWNIPPNTTDIAENSVPQGVQGTTDFGQTAYGGPCPPSGSHRYFFKLYALETELRLPETATKADLLKVIESHVIDSAELIGLYQRQ